MLIWHAGRGRLRTGAASCKLQGWIRRTDRMQRWISGLRLLERFGMSKPLACTMLREIAPPSFWHAKATVAPRRESPVLARMQCSEPSAYPLAFLNGSRGRIAHFAIHASFVGIPSGFAECGIKGDNPRGRRPPCGTPWGCAKPHPTNASTWALVIAHRFGLFQEGVVSCTALVRCGLIQWTTWFRHQWYCCCRCNENTLCPELSRAIGHTGTLEVTEGIG
jgi:hypothetical protein